jgi:pilus assembly protein Flp/PilA
MMNQIAKFYRDESGASSVEYAFLLVFIALAIYASVQTLGTTLSGVFSTAASSVSST